MHTLRFTREGNLTFGLDLLVGNEMSKLVKAQVLDP